MKTILDAHCHSVASGHAYSTVNEIALSAGAKGLKLVAVTDHAPEMPGSCGLFHFFNMGVIPRELHGVRVCSGVELNIMKEDGTVDMPENILKLLDVVIASLHPPCFVSAPGLDVTKTLINTMKNPYVRIIGHPGDSRYPFDIDAVVDAAVANGVILEINNSSLTPNSVRDVDIGAVERIVQACMARDWPVILGSDSHFMDSVGDVAEAAKLVQRVGMPERLVINTSLDLFEKYILHRG